MHRKLVIAGALGALLAAPALAETTKPKSEPSATPLLPSAVQDLPKDMLPRIDSDGDGLVSEAELDAARAGGLI